MRHLAAAHLPCVFWSNISDPFPVLSQFFPVSCQLPQEPDQLIRIIAADRTDALTRNKISGPCPLRCQDRTPVPDGFKKFERDREPPILMCLDINAEKVCLSVQGVKLITGFMDNMYIVGNKAIINMPHALPLIFAAAKRKGNFRYL